MVKADRRGAIFREPGRREKQEDHGSSRRQEKTAGRSDRDDDKRKVEVWTI